MESDSLRLMFCFKTLNLMFSVVILIASSKNLCFSLLLKLVTRRTLACQARVSLNLFTAFSLLIKLNLFF
ncbi:Uncharacterized protein APZ42_021598 [Daphnia magna]|uniref:Uncharacterized protein n=1 Tax=Daphnia magna TaxID=35525 RepID=A0A0P5SMP0_9CRUS|nr:Uncharacterized protein APZ42_021598 [Daphnia magna]